jgi:hypothetical protein
MGRMTILDVTHSVLASAKQPLTAQEIHAAVVEQSLFTFKARDPVAIVRAAIRKHLRSHGGPGQPPARLRQVDGGRFVAM